jgi:NAD(P)-dependent dehydrogenase (short-subunit alcohol dehydrogenase family)/acyl dehydratase
VTEASFVVEVTSDSALEFAKLSGDWNPLHTDPAHAATTAYRRPVLHGAFSAGLVSRLAGMYLPGKDCLLHNLELKFVAPIVPPATLLVSGRLTSERHGVGRVEATVSDTTSGAQYVTAAYQFGRHQHEAERLTQERTTAAADGRRVVLVTGASGGLGRAVVGRLGDRALGVSRAGGPGLLAAASVTEIGDLLDGLQLDAIVHCAWPAPDNQQLVALADPDTAVGYHLGRPLGEMIRLARLLKDRGTPGAQLILIGSTAAMPGRHNYRMPLYSLAKSIVPELVRILAVELASSGHRVTGVVFDVIEAGMNQRLSASAKIAHANRSPSGRLPSGDDAAAQLEWILSSPGWLASGATVTLSGGALP